MRKSRIVFIGILVLVVLFNPLAWADPTITIDDIVFGDLLMGEPVTNEGLKEHVVAIAYTGIY